MVIFLENMATHTIDVIQVQPQVQSQSSAVSLQAQFNELIIKEISASTLLMSNLSFNYFSLNILTRYLGSGPTYHYCDLCTLPSLNCCCLQLPQWYVYLTSTHVHIEYKSCCSTCMVKYQIALTDIVEIKTVSHVIDGGYCGLGTKIASSVTMIIELKPESAKQFLPICCKWCTVPLVITFHCDEDTTEFVTAVKQNMAKMARE